jgi:RNA polymerase sigma-70 factor (ECF subfamily)
VVNRAINTAEQFRKLVPLEGCPDDVDEPLSLRALVAALPGPEALVEQKDLQQTVRKALDQLSPKQRAAVILRYYLEMSEVEITQEMAIPRSSVKWWLFTARKRLRLLLHALRPEESEPVPCPSDRMNPGRINPHG